MIKVREMVNAFDNAEELGATFIFRYEGWDLDKETDPAQKKHYKVDEEDIKDVGYRPLLAWYPVFVHNNTETDSDIWLLIFIVPRDPATEEDKNEHAKPLLVTEVEKLLDMTTTLQTCEITNISVKAYDTYYHYVEKIHLTYIEDNQDEDEDFRGSELEIGIQCAETGIVFDWSGFNQLITGEGEVL